MKRPDAVEVFEIEAYNKVFPFIMKKRADSLVYHACELDVSNTIKFIRDYNSKNPEVRLKFFYVLGAALMRTIALRPQLNRFIMGNRFWQRNEYSMNFVVKQSLTDEAPETSTPIYFRPDMTLEEYAAVMDSYVNQSRKADEDNFTDDFVKVLYRIPVWVVGIFVNILGWLDRMGICPKFLREADGLHTSIFISNLGSIGISGGSPHHHLYEWGTTSLFVTVGGMSRKRVQNEEGEMVRKEFVEFGATVDERISTGWYFVKSMGLFMDLMNHPEKLMERPVLPPPPLTKREFRAKLRQEAKERKALLKAKKKASNGKGSI